MVLDAAAKLHNLAVSINASLAGCETVIEISGSRKKIGYYCVHHPTRTIFWLEEFKLNGKNVFERTCGVEALSQAKNAVEAQYWKHIELYPNDRCLSQEIVDEIRETILHSRAEMLTSSTSITPFTEDELKDMLPLLGMLQGIFGIYMTCKLQIARFLHTFVRSRFFNFYGQFGARLDNDQALYQDSDQCDAKLTRIFTGLSYALFRAPNVHLRTLQRVWVNNQITQVSWRPFIKQLNTEWAELILNSTVIMTANVAFLAIPGVTTANSPSTIAQIFSYASTVASIGAIVIGLLLVRQNRTKGIDDANEALSFMTALLNTNFGKEALAIMYSLPYALLIWGMVFFVAALGSLTFKGTDKSTRVSIGVVFFLVGSLVFWCVFNSWEQRTPRKEHDRNVNEMTEQSKLKTVVVHGPSKPMQTV
ncbi:hypothetical protein BDQ12DRAFT_655674 [Crucibulum laeve]|uniref:Uncharacterized protein n=1 Tax=Crucibulum laeve TaxID=68775 RepID=A0A5C3LQD6_9AGAR|nr:hypothetical protein BDQ12DRAFT_655674 [Crucibulum laeve]